MPPPTAAARRLTLTMPGLGSAGAIHAPGNAPGPGFCNDVPGGCAGRIKRRYPSPGGVTASVPGHHDLPGNGQADRIVRRRERR